MAQLEFFNGNYCHSCGYYESPSSTTIPWCRKKPGRTSESGSCRYHTNITPMPENTRKQIEMERKHFGRNR